jgi:hypothetical protein
MKTIMFFSTFRTEAMREFGCRVSADIILNRLPVFPDTDLFAG